MFKVKDLMSVDLITLQADESLDLANEVMRLGRVRHLPVIAGGELVGLVTHRDLLKAQVSALAGLSREETSELEQRIPVASIMIRDVVALAPEASALQAAKLMVQRKIGCIPVVDHGKLVGIVTEADFLDLVVRALDQESSHDG
jgi:CBS domain-containing membrane protein